jgi:hypothetical protein
MNTRLFENIFTKMAAATLACIALMPGNSVAVVARDNSLDYECKPRWDKFIVDENATNWDKTAVDCFGRYENNGDIAKLYGSPNEYGEYEAGYVDVPLLRTMYGNVVEYLPASSAPKPKAKPAPVKKNSTKKIVRAAKPKVIPVSKPVKSIKPAPKPVVVDIVAEPTLAPVPDERALGIAKSLKEEIVTAETYCDQVNPPIRGALPKDVILMPGRPDLMSCVKNQPGQ